MRRAGAETQRGDAPGEQRMREGRRAPREARSPQQKAEENAKKQESRRAGVKECKSARVQECRSAGVVRDRDRLDGGGGVVGGGWRVVHEVSYSKLL